MKSLTVTRACEAASRPLAYDAEGLFQFATVLRGIPEGAFNFKWNYRLKLSSCRTAGCAIGAAQVLWPKQIGSSWDLRKHLGMTYEEKEGILINQPIDTSADHIADLLEGLARAM